MDEAGSPWWGAEALKRQPAPGARPRLSEHQRARVPELLERGAEAHGFRGDVWTCERVAIVIRREFGVSYHPAHVSRLLKALRQSLQKPKRRAEQRDEEAIDNWKEKKWPSSEKRALKEGRTILFCDQSGFYLLPMVVRTYAPVGDILILKENLTRDHLSAMSAITLEGKLYMTEQERAFKGEDVVRFLKHLMRQIAGKLLVIWDGSPIHRGAAVKDSWTQRSKIDPLINES